MSLDVQCDNESYITNDIFDKKTIQLINESDNLEIDKCDKSENRRGVFLQGECESDTNICFIIGVEKSVFIT